MPLIKPCAHEGCEVLTMGLYCIDHEQPTDRCVIAALIDAASSAADATRENED